MSILDLNFADVVVKLLEELGEGSAVFALRGGEQAYYVEGVISEIKNKTKVGEQFAKVVLGTAVEMALRDKDHINQVKVAEKSADEFLKKYMNINMPGCDK